MTLSRSNANGQGNKKGAKEVLEALFDKPTTKPGEAMATKLEEIQKQIEQLQSERVKLLSQERIVAVADINRKIALFELKPRDLNFGTGSKAGSPMKAKSVAAKYQKDGQVWSGRGIKPKWVVSHIEGGGKIEDLLIK
jgi:DNA-binding protein H-NS